MTIYFVEAAALEHRCQYCGVIADSLFCQDCSQGEGSGNPEPSR